MRNYFAFWMLTTLVVVALASVAWGAGSRETFPVSGTAFVSCTSETVDFTGSCHQVITATSNSSGGEQLSSSQNCHLAGVAETTGTQYIANEEFTFTVTFTSGQSATSTFPMTITMISLGSEPNFLLHALIHLTINADGTETTNITIFSAECTQ